MSELVPVSNHTSVEPVGKMTKKAKRTSILALPERHKRALSSKENLFKPAIDVAWQSERTDLIEDMLPIGGSLMGCGVVFGVVGMVASGATAPMAWEIFSGILGAAQAYWLITGFIAAPPLRARKRNFNALVDWLGARYGITLNAKQGLPTFISQKHRSNRWHTFADDRGQSLALVDDGTAFFVTKTGTNNTEYPLTIAAKAPKVKQAAAISLPKNLVAVHSDVDRLIAKLNQRDLSPESDHVVSRASRDLEKVLILYTDLRELDAVTQHQLQNVTRVLTQLRVELTGVLQRETDWALNALSVETTYVTAREERVGFKIK